MSCRVPELRAFGRHVQRALYVSVDIEHSFELHTNRSKTLAQVRGLSNHHDDSCTALFYPCAFGVQTVSRERKCALRKSRFSDRAVVCLQ